MSGRAHEPHLDGPRGARRAAAHALLHPRGLGKQVACSGKERRAAVGQLDAAAGAPEELHAEPLLQSLDLLAERGLRDAEPCRRAPKVEFLGHGDEVAQVPELKWF